MKSQRIGLRFSKKDIDIISWFLMLRENNIEQSFAVKTLLKAFFLNENINGGTVKLREKSYIEPTSISINENDINDDIMQIKVQGIKLAAFTKDIIRMYIKIGNEDKIPDISYFQNINTKYKMKYLNNIFYNTFNKVENEKGTIKYNENKLPKIDNSKQVKENIDYDENKSVNEIKVSKRDFTNQNLSKNSEVLKADKTNNIYKENNEVEQKIKVKKDIKPKKKNPLLAQI